MSSSKYHQGWYKLKYPQKFIAPLDECMKSSRISKDGVFLEYKSSLEFKFIRYCEINRHIIKFGLEPFPIRYLSPRDNKFHRYYVDFFVVFDTGTKILVEIKPFSQTVPPNKPKNLRGEVRFAKELMTYAVNCAKWEAARAFCAQHGFKFVIITEKELK